VEIVCCCFAEQFSRETIVGDITIFRKTIELNLPEILGISIAAGSFKLRLSTGTCLIWHLSRTIASQIAKISPFIIEYNLEANQ